MSGSWLTEGGNGCSLNVIAYNPLNMKSFQRVGKLASTGLTIFLLFPALSGCFFTQRSELIVETENLSKALDEGSSVLKEYFLTLNDFDREGFKLVLSLNQDCDLQSDYSKKVCFISADFYQIIIVPINHR